MYKNEETRKAYYRKWQIENRDRLNQNTGKRRMNRRTQAVEMLGGACVRCGSKNALHFDHIDPKTKHDAIGRLLSSKNEIFLAELAKCQLLCHDCHRQKTKEDCRNAAEHGTATMYNAYKCRCNNCRLWKRNYDIEWKIQKKHRQTS